MCCWVQVTQWRGTFTSACRGYQCILMWSISVWAPPHCYIHTPINCASLRRLHTPDECLDPQLGASLTPLSIWMCLWKEEPGSRNLWVSINLRFYMRRKVGLSMHNQELSKTPHAGMGSVHQNHFAGRIIPWILSEMGSRTLPVWVRVCWCRRTDANLMPLV